MIKWLTRRERYILFAAAGCILIFVLYSFIIEPAVQKYGEFDREISSQKIKLVRMIRLVQDRDRITSEYKKYEELLREKGSKEEELASFLNEIETLARTSSVKIADIKPQPVKDENLYDRYGAEVETEAAIEQLMYFLRGVQNSPSLLLAERLQINVKAGAPGVLKSKFLITKILLK